MYKKLLTKIISREDLTKSETYEMMNLILDGELTLAQIGGFMTAMACKGETFEELAGAAECMRSKASRIQPIVSPLVDTCGTGGDGSDTFNISTASAIVAAGAGVKIAKHGNRSVSSKCGSADVLETLGLNLAVDVETVEMSVNEIGIGFMFAPNYHKAMKYAGPARKEIGVRSIFNMLGPLTNPAGADRQVLGVFKAELTEMFAQALKLLGARKAFVVHGHDGLDEISVCGPTRISELSDGQVKTYDLFPEQYLGEVYDAEDLVGGDPQVNAGIITNILDGQTGACRDVVVINAAAAIAAADIASDLREGIDLAREAIDSGKAKDKLKQMIEFA